MKPVHLRIYPVCVAITAAIACSKSSGTSNTTCTAETGDTGPLFSNQPVSYSATVQGGANITSVSYQDSAGMTTVKNPVLPFSKTVNLRNGQLVSISATGTSTTGEIKVTSNGNSPNSASCP
jgi:hypothetical protein